MANEIFNRIGKAEIKHSNFDLGHTVLGNCEAGKLIPVYYQEAVPGDRFNIKNQIVVRLTPLMTPVLQDMNILINYFFCPTRLLWDKWEDAITGGEDGLANPTYPIWNDPNRSKGSIWDYLGLPLTGLSIKGAEPNKFLLRMYNLIYNEYYRDQNIQDKVDLDQEALLNRAWEKDYFTASLPFQQRGIAPSIPLTGTGQAIFEDINNYTDNEWSSGVDQWYNYNLNPTAGFSIGKLTYNAGRIYGTNTNDGALYQTTYASISNPKTSKIGDEINHLHKIGNIRNALNITWKEFLDKNQIDMSNIATFNVSDLRNIVQLQKWLERNARAGARYTEFLNAHFNEAPSDARLQRPELIFSTGNPIVISEVLQTSSTDSTSPQGNLAGHGMSVGDNDEGYYHALEYGWIMAIMTIMPKPLYASQGIPRELRRRSRLEQFYPEFVNLSEQAVDNAELCAAEDSTDKTDEEKKEANLKIFGYIGRYDEMRYRRSYICADMRDELAEWHMARIFTNQPSLNEDFIKCVPTKRIFSAQGVNDKNYIYYINHIVSAVRPLPLMSEPGLIDHI